MCASRGFGGWVGSKVLPGGPWAGAVPRAGIRLLKGVPDRFSPVIEAFPQFPCLIEKRSVINIQLFRQIPFKYFPDFSVRNVRATSGKKMLLTDNGAFFCSERSSCDCLICLI
jgi:hypothetical protein